MPIVLYRSRRLSVLLAVLTALSATRCGTSAPVPATPAAESRDDATVVGTAAQREIDQAETRERNRNGPAFTSEELHALMENPTHKPHLKLWRELRSFYALLEIAEGIVEPEIGRIRRQDIQELLGKGNPDYPTSNGRILEYAGERHIPAGAHLLIYFDERDIVDRVDWVSE